ncbi:hypothetical protein CERSUDRAFT_68868 [Gelatoporia subvermispora B]|uniref:CxC2-like cysteine cluster KDZ transposase-associated domain-containing protein n=1 Tax=Ceriporiopsis subvermispora (strain B) TaxID=914234 RepID=M2R238_CERS8|nr:hypothetical protein CERSUDRAFT_68868 [Gelatoporia subvermispora B]
MSRRAPRTSRRPVALRMLALSLELCRQAQSLSSHLQKVDHPLIEWLPAIDDWLAELLRLEGRGDYCGNTCARCKSELAEFHCKDCMDLRLYCRSCTVELHAQAPLHRISVLQHFVKTSLKDLGLRIQLGHPPGSICIAPARAFNDDFVIIDTSGIHCVALDFCGCETAHAHTVQLLRHRLLPATPTSPKTTGTFRLVQMFQLLPLQSKVSGWEFYQCLTRSTDNTGLDDVKDRYLSFMRMMREWRHLKMLKRAARGHDPGGVASTTQGSCAILCPACPHPGKNLPPDWQNVAQTNGMCWLYCLFVAMDANFHLRRKDVSDDKNDPGLNHGYSYFVEEKAYKSYLATYSNLVSEDKSSCHDHEAIKLAQRKGAKDLAATGLGTVECSRHDMKRPCSVGDLQKGERYGTLSSYFTDYSLIKHSYRYWTRHLFDRFAKYRWKLTFGPDPIQFLFLIPKFHLPAHQDSCQYKYSFNYHCGCGRTDGEAPERGWAWADPLASSTREMGPGSRRDLIDDAFADYNWRKICRMAVTFLRKIKEAERERRTQVTEFDELSATIPTSLLEQWTTNVVALEEHSVATVRLQLTAEDEVAAADSTAVTLIADISASRLLSIGFELEESQRRLREAIAKLGAHSTDLQRAKIKEQQNALQRRLDAWVQIQAVYMLFVPKLRQEAQVSTPEKAQLFMPSQIPAPYVCGIDVLQYEWRLHFAQAFKILDDLRRHLRLRTSLRKLKEHFARGVRTTMRALGVVAKAKEHIKGDSTQYHAARSALEALASRLQVQPGWDDEDVREMQSDPDSGVSEGRRSLSWIWRMPGVIAEDDSEGVNEAALHIEWCKSRARVNRWSEECELLQEEMRRVTAFHEWQANWWIDRIGSCVTLNQQRPSDRDSHLEGASAYARRQCRIRCTLKDSCSKAWKYVPQWLSDSYKS